MSPATHPPNVSLNVETVRTLVSPCGDALVLGLHKKRYQRTLLGICRIHERLLDEAHEVAETTGFAAAFDLLRSYPPAEQEQVLSYPSIAFWVDVAEDLLRRESHVRFPEMHFSTHLEAFWRIVLAVSTVTSSGSFTCRTRTDASARLCLPGTGVYLQLPSFCSLQQITVSADQGILRVLSPDKGVPALEASRLPIPTIHGVELNSVDTDLRLPGRTRFNYQQLEPADVIKWESPVEQSMDWIRICSPMLSGEMQRALRCIVPVRSDKAEVHMSATFREAPGLMALSWTPDAAVLVEAMVHEYHHGKLNSLLVLDPLIVGPTEEAIFYSPWRSDPRPLLGILHGAFVFQAVLEFWDRFFKAEIPLLQQDRVRQRMYLIQCQLRHALATLEREAALSDLGTALLAAMKSNVDRFETNLPEKDQAIQQRLDQVQEEHRAAWEQANPGVRTDSGAVRPTTIAGIDTGTGHPLILESFRWLGTPANLDLASLANAFPVTDTLMERLVVVHKERGLDELARRIAGAQGEFPPLMNLLAGHLFYIVEQFERAAVHYALLVQQLPRSSYFWQCLAFSVRHLGYAEEAHAIITNLGLLAAKGRQCDESEAPVLERLSEVKLVLSEGGDGGV